MSIADMCALAELSRAGYGGVRQRCAGRLRNEAGTAALRALRKAEPYATRCCFTGRADVG